MSYINRTYNHITEKYTMWTTDTPDTNGVSFPGPGVFGDDTEGFSSWAVPGSGSGGSASQFSSSSGQWEWSVIDDPDFDIGMVVYKDDAGFVRVYRATSGPERNQVLGVVTAITGEDSCTVVYAGIFDFGEPTIPPFVAQMWASPDGYVSFELDELAEMALQIGIPIDSRYMMIRIGIPVLVEEPA